MRNQNITFSVQAEEPFVMKCEVDSSATVKQQPFEITKASFSQPNKNKIVEPPATRDRSPELRTERAALLQLKHEYQQLELTLKRRTSNEGKVSDANKHLKAENEELKKRLDSYSGHFSKQKDQIRDFEDKYGKIQASEQRLQQEIGVLKPENKDLKKKLDSCEEEILKLKEKIRDYQDKCGKKEAAEQKLQKEIGELKEQITDAEIIADKVPSLSITMDSLLDLNDPNVGWQFNSPDFEKLKVLMEKKMVILAVLGMYDVGKSRFCNEFTGKKEFNSGYSQRTEGLNFSFPQENGTLITVIDTSGSSEAIRVNDPKLIEKITNANQEKAAETAKNDDDYMLRYEMLKNDAKILQALKEKFISEVADVLVVVCNKLSEKEQEGLYKLIRHHQAINNDRVKDARQTRGVSREKFLYVVHNYKMLTEIEQVQNQIEKDLKNSFNVTEIPLFTSMKEEYKDCNLNMFEDQFGVFHFILAKDGSNAGKYYNPSTFHYIKEKVQYMGIRTSANIKQLFLDFCNKSLPKMLKKEDVKVKFDTENERIIKEGGSKIVLENLRYDAFGDFVVSSSFEPRYSMTERALDDVTRELVVDLELLDTTYIPSIIQNSGAWFLIIKGNKTITANSDPKLKETITENSREQGNFHLKIRLSAFQLNEDEVKIEDLKNGIVRFTCSFRETKVINLKLTRN